MAGPAAVTFRTPQVVALEATYGPENALAAVSAGRLQLGCFADQKGVVVATYDAGQWTATQRFDEFWTAMRQVGHDVDLHRDELPISSESSPIPVVVLPATESYQALCLTNEGVVLLTEMLDRPGRFDIPDRPWPSFEAALNALADEFDLFG